jgi:hypothetical protein
MSELNWQGNAGGYAHGREHIYLITWTPDGEFRLTRWRRTSTALPHDVLLAARQAARNVIVIDGPDQGRAIASRFESGEPIPGVSAWQREARAGDSE